MLSDQDRLLQIIDSDYRSNHMYWIERRLNKRLEKWFRNNDEVEIDDLLAERHINDLQIEVFSFYNKKDYAPVTKLDPDAYHKWVNAIITGWAVRKTVSVWSKIKMASKYRRSDDDEML